MDAASVARFYCEARAHGETDAEISRRIDAKCKRRETICDCERILVVLRQALQVAVVVLAAIALARFAVMVVPALLRISVFLLPTAARLFLPRAMQQARMVTDQSRVIEGVFVRIREEVASMSTLVR